MKCQKLMIVAMVGLGALVWMGLDSRHRMNANKYQSPVGFKLVAQYEPLHLYIYVDTTSTNRSPDYLICEGSNDMVYSENIGSNKIETTYFENGYPVLLTRNDKAGRVLKRVITYSDSAGQMQCTYMDNDGDGLWDTFLNYAKGEYYVRSNLCWVLKYQGSNQP